MMPIPCLAERGGGQKLPESPPESFVDKDPNALFQNIYPVSCERPDGSGCSNIKLIAGLKRHCLERFPTDLSDERVLSLVANHTKWNPFFLCTLSRLCKKIRAISDRHLWREFCRSRAPRMVSDLLLGAEKGRVDGGWMALGKLFLYCAGCYQATLGFPMQAVTGHSVPNTRFSSTSGRSFLMPRCRSDVLYISDPCEHANNPEDVGSFRGVFKSFDKSETKKLLTSKRVPLSEEKCPFCKAGVWNMSRAGMIPKSASSRLAAYNENVEYSICHNGHVNGRCALLHLSESDEAREDE